MKLLAVTPELTSLDLLSSIVAGRLRYSCAIWWRCRGYHSGVDALRPGKRTEIADAPGWRYRPFARLGLPGGGPDLYPARGARRADRAAIA